MAGQAQSPDRPAKDQAAVGVPSGRAWPYDHRYSRPDITEGQARAESYYAWQMASAAAAGKIDKFLHQYETKVAT